MISTDRFKKYKIIVNKLTFAQRISRIDPLILKISRAESLILREQVSLTDLLIDGLYVRDRIVLNPALVSRLRPSTNAPRPLLRLVAREIVVEGAVKFNNIDLVLIADKLEGSGSITVNALDVVQPNQEGAIGNSVIVVCRKLHGVTVTAAGGKGGAGNEGERGKRGEDGEFDPEIKRWVQRCTNGGKGGRGTPGAPGGKGGSITLVYVHDRVLGGFKAVEQLRCPGGAGGDGGPGGPGGAPGKAVPACSVGNSGDPGTPGPTGHSPAPHVLQVSETDYWQEVRERAPEWAVYRLRAAIYMFRKAMALSGTDRSQALDEFEAVLHLVRPDTPSVVAEQAQRYLAYLHNYQNFLGLPHDLTLIPDFETYRRTMVEYEPQIRSMFYESNNLVLSTLNFQNVQKVLQVERDHLASNALQAKLKAEEQAAQSGLAEATLALDDVAARIEQTRELIRQIENDILIKPFDDGIEMLLGNLPLAIGIVAGAIASIAIPGAGGAIAMAVLPMATELLVSSEAKTDVDAALRNAKDLGTELEKLKQNSKGLSDYIKDKNNWSQAGKTVISFGKVAQELATVKTGKDPRQSQLTSLYSELASLTQQKFLAQLRTEQATFMVAGATAAQSLAAEDLQRVEALLSNLTGDEQALRQAVITCLHTARRAQDLLLTYIFRAARAFDIFTLSEHAPQVRYDYGVLNPDDEVNYLMGLTSPLDMIQAIIKAMPTIVSLDLKSAYDNYRNQEPGLASDDPYTYTFTADTLEHAAVIDRFKKSGSLTIRVDLDDLLPRRYEVKAAGIRVRLNGVSGGEAFVCRVTHEGYAQQHRLVPQGSRDVIVSQALTYTTDKVIVQRSTTTPTLYEGTAITTSNNNPEIQLRCWGRGMAALWTVSIDKDTGPVDLSQVHEIMIQLENMTFDRS